MVLRSSLLAALSTLAVVGETCANGASIPATSLLARQASVNAKVDVREEAGQGDVEFSEKQLAVMCYMKQQFALTSQQTVPPAALAAVAPNRTCAVVSNSGALLDFNYGPEIDSHDVIIRFNRAETAGYETHVGSRTDVRTGWLFGKFEGFHTDFIKWNPSDVRIQVMDRLYPRRLGVRHAAADEPTSGFMGMVLALSYCAVVDTYEMTPSKDASRSRYHYYAPEKHDKFPSATENSYHSFFKAEHDLWARLSLTPLVEVHNTGKTRVKGFNSIECPADSAPPMDWEPSLGLVVSSNWWSLAGLD